MLQKVVHLEHRARVSAEATPAVPLELHGNAQSQHAQREQLHSRMDAFIHVLCDVQVHGKGLIMILNYKRATYITKPKDKQFKNTRKMLWIVTVLVSINASTSNK